MNGVLIKSIGIGLVGAFTGALAVYLWLDKKYNEEVEELQASFQKVLSSNKDTIDELQEKIDIYEGAGIDFNTAKIVFEKNKQSYEAVQEQLNEDESVYTKYSEISKDYKSKNDEEYVSEEDPYMISEDSFADDHDEYKKVCCTYYTQDDILYDSSHGEIIELEHVGSECRDILENSELDGPLYVRNDYLGIDYEIDIFDGSYHFEILGEEELDE